MLLTGTARAGVWGADPSIGMSADHGSNPALLNVPNPRQTDVALLLDSPVTYHGDAWRVALSPSLRVSDTRSYNSLNSNYFHLNASGQLNSERNSFELGIGASRDSSLYQNFLINGESAVRRDAAHVDLSWTHHLSERLDADLGLSSTRVNYARTAGATSLTDYRYSSVAPELSWAWTERDKLTLSGSGGRYDSVDGVTSSRNWSAQLGYERSLTEVWSFNAAAGYSRSRNRLTLQVPQLVVTGGAPKIVLVPVRLTSQVGSGVYAVHVARSGPRLGLVLSATRQQVPTGFAYLSRQVQLEVLATYALSERWSVSLHDLNLSAHDPAPRGRATDRTINALTLTTSWQWSELLKIDFALTRVDENYRTPSLSLANNQATLTLTYKFNHIDMQ